MTGSVVCRFPGDRGAALLVVLMSTTLLMGLGAGLALLTMTEARIAAHFVAGIEALYAADAAIERIVPDLAAADWVAVAAGSVRSTFVDGDPEGLRDTDGGSPLDLTVATNLERCGRPAACADGEADVPWRVYAHAPIEDVLPPGRMRSRVYVIVWVADTGAGPGFELVLRARAYGQYGSRRAVEVVIARGDVAPRVLSWRELW